MNAASLSRVTPKLILGLGILILGTLWTLDNLDFLESERITDWWPAIIIAVGLVKLLDPSSNRIGGIVITAVGTVMLLNSLGLTDWDLGDMIPLGIALLGAKLVYDAVNRRERPGNVAVDADSEIHAFAMMGGVKRQSTAVDFRGGDANAIMGAVELDLTQTKIRDGEQAVIDAFAMMGGVEIKVPSNWKVIGNVLPLMGAFEDNTSAKGESGGPVLLVRGTAIMGAIEVKN